MQKDSTADFLCPMNSVIEVKKLSFGYTPQDTLLADVSFDIKAGTFFSIAGPNGAGKTTLLNLICGLVRTQTGSILIDAAPVQSYSVRSLAQRIAVVRQEFVPVFDFTVAEVVSMARTPYLGTFGFESIIDQEAVDQALEATGTAQFASRPLRSLSGGERQRVLIARALAQNTAILLLDEPTSFLDLKHQVNIYDLLKVAQLEKGKTIVAVTHDINLAAQYSDEILLLTGSSPDGIPTPRNYHVGTTKDVFVREQIERVFGVSVFAGKIGKENFFIPLGRLAKDSRQMNDI